MMKKETNALQVIARTAHCPEYSAGMIKRLMATLGVNEKGFALLMNVTPTTVRLWVSGAVQPSSTAKRLMQIYENGPEIVGTLVDEQAGAESENDR